MTKTAIIHIVAVVVVWEMAAKMLLKIQIKLQPWQVRVAHRYVSIFPVDSWNPSAVLSHQMWELWGSWVHQQWGRELCWESCSSLVPPLSLSWERPVSLECVSEALPSQPSLVLLFLSELSPSTLSHSRYQWQVSRWWWCSVWWPGWPSSHWAALLLSRLLHFHLLGVQRSCGRWQSGFWWKRLLLWVPRPCLWERCWYDLWLGERERHIKNPPIIPEIWD